MNRPSIALPAWLVPAVLISLCTSLAMAESTIPIERFQLDNGMTFLLVHRDEATTVSLGWAAHVGSVNEDVGTTGLAHLFEHMLFKGSRTIGTKDIEAELKIMEQLDALRAQLEKEYSALRAAKRRGEIEGSIYDPRNATEKITELRRAFKKLQDEQRQYIVKDEFSKVYKEAGATSLNAFTSEDATVYIVGLPPQKLELWFWMESDRLANPVFREFYSERDVVREERRMRTESNPVRPTYEQFDAMFWSSSPYGHPVVGWPSDVEAIPRDRANEFFATYYAPNNLTAAIVGPFDGDEVKRLAEKYFGRLERGQRTPPEVVTEEVDQLAERRMSAAVEANPEVMLRWRGLPFVHRDAPVLDVIVGLLTGATGRLNRRLVDQLGVASGRPYAQNDNRKYDGVVEVSATVAEGHTHEELEQALTEIIEELKTAPVGERELQKVKNIILADSYRAVENPFGLMVQLAYYDALGNANYLNEIAGAVQAITPADVQRVATAIFRPERRNVLWISRKENVEEDPDLAALDPKPRKAARRMIGRLAAIDDPGVLANKIAELEGHASEAPPEYQPAIQLVLRRAKERLAQLDNAAKEGN